MEEKQLNENLEFMRSAVKKTDTSGECDWLSFSVVVVLCLICMAIYISVHFFVRSQNYQYIWPVFLTLAAVAGCYSFIGLSLSFRNDRKAGFVSYIPKQVIAIWVLALVNGLVWSIMGKVFNNFICGEPGFLFAMLFAIALGATSILDPDSKAWCLGSIIIFAGMVLTYLLRGHVYLILGLATGAGLIIPAIMININCTKQEKSYE